jgi:hypothetical protein
MSRSRIAFALIISAVVLGVSAVPLLAQDAAVSTPRNDVYVGVGRTTTSREGNVSNHHSTDLLVVKFGWNLSRRVGLVFDGGFSVHSGWSVEYSVTTGPRFAFINRSRLVPFVQVAAGVKREMRMTVVYPATVAYDPRLVAQVAAACGLDVVVGRGWVVRVLQVEEQRILASGATNKLVVSAGVVFRFGSHPRSK